MKKNCKRNSLSYIVLLVVIIACGYLTFTNFSKKTFFRANAIEILTLFTGAVIVFYLSERKTDQRRRNDCIEHIITEIEKFMTDEDNFAINKNTLFRQSSCANRIKYLKDASFQDISDDIEFIENKFEEIRDLYSNHNQNEEELSKVKIHIDKHRGNIVDKCCKIRIGLYK